MRPRFRSAAASAAIMIVLSCCGAGASAQAAVGPLVASADPFGTRLCLAGALSFGEAPLSGTIAVAGESDCLGFTGAAGDRVRVRVVTTSGSLLARAEIPSAVCAPVAGAELTCTLGAGAGHAVVVRDAHGTQTGGYAVSLQRLDDPVGCSGLSFDPATRTGAISAGETECWRITGSSGDWVRLRMVTAAAALAPRLEVLRPDGTTHCPAAAAVDQTCVLERTGTHTILVRDGGAGSGGYSLSAQRLNDPVGCSLKAFGTTAAAGGLATTGETDCWRFDGVAGLRVRVRVLRTAGTLDSTVEVLRPTGTTRCAATRAGGVTCTLDSSGRHTVLVRDAAAGTRTGTYRLALQRLREPVGCSALSFGTGVTTASLTSTGQTSCWRFTANADDTVRVRVVPTTAALQPVVEILDGGGRTDCGPVHIGTYDFTCNLGGFSSEARTLLIHDSGTNSGDYRFSMQRLNDPVGCGAEPGSEGVDGWVAVAAVDCWRVDGEQGDLLRIRTIDTGSGLAPVIEVLRPDGTTVCNRTTADSFTCTLDSEGLHTVLVRGAAGGSSGGYRISTIALNDAYHNCPNLTTSPPAHTASIVGDAEVDCYTSWAPYAGARSLRVEATSGTLQPVVEVLRPAGTLRCKETAPDGWFDCYGDIYEHQRILVYDAGGRGHGNYEIDRR